MKKTLYYCSFCVISAFIACKEATKAPIKATEAAPIVVEQPLSFKIEKIEKIVGDTLAKKNENAEFAQIHFIFPKAIGGKKGVSDSINNWVANRLKEPIYLGDGNPTKLTLDTTIQQFFAAQKQAMKEFPNMASNAWSNEVTGKVTFQNNNIACLETTAYSYNGGAHPNSFVAYQIFDINTGKKVAAQKGITNMSAFLALAEKKFRVNRKIPAKTSFEKAYFNFPEKNKFSLPANIGLSEKGLTLFYNDYEVASHATGSTELFIPFEELTGIFDKNLLM
jgi:Deacetylase PdaC/Protein of unknown function (DUF3298)